MTTLPAWFGKLPSAGDFVSRRMPPDTLDCWDDWLGTGLSNWRDQDPDGWLDQYLASPCWRFVLMPSALAPGSGPQAGVLMPSVDRVGRYFPLTLLQPMARLPLGTLELQELLSWLHQMDDLVVDALQEDWSIEQLEAALALPGSAVPAWVVAPGAALRRVWPDSARAAPAQASPWVHTPAADLATGLAMGAAALVQGTLEGQAWWCCVDALGQAHVLVSQGLPGAQQFIDLFTPLPTLLPGAAP